MTSEQERIVRQFAEATFPRHIPHRHDVYHHHADDPTFAPFCDAYLAGFRVGYSGAEWPDTAGQVAIQVGARAGYIKGRGVAADPGFWEQATDIAQLDESQYGHTHTADCQPTIRTAAGEVETIPDGAILSGESGVWILRDGEWQAVTDPIERSLTLHGEAVANDSRRLEHIAKHGLD